MIHFRVLGGVELRDGESGEFDAILAQPKRLAILAYLCVAGRGGFVRRETLLSLFWPESDPEHARAALNQSLYVLRRALDPEVLPGRGAEEVRADPACLSCDAVAFLDALDAEDRTAALDLYRGDLLPGLAIDSAEFDRWLDRERASLRGAALRAALSLGAESAGAGDLARAAGAFRRGLEIVPESESAARGLVETLWRAGRRTIALESYERFAAHLAEEYGVAPGPAICALAERIRNGEPTTPGDPSRPPRTTG